MIKVETFTSIGNRAENQDFFAYQLIGEEAGVFVVTDGMGGYEKGDEAARIVAESVVEYTTDHWKDFDVKTLIKEAYIYANESLSLRRLAIGGKKMGTCVCALILRGEHAYLSWFGDSRVYQYSNELEVYRTADHSVVNELAKINTLRVEDIEKYSNIVTRSIMGNMELDPLDIVVRGFNKRDQFILCTDGLHKSISLPIRLQADFITQLEERGDNYGDNATCMVVSV